MTTRAFQLMLLMLSVIGSVAHGEEVYGMYPAPGAHIHFETSPLKQLFDKGMIQSDTFRGLVDRLNRSDLIVCVDSEFFPPVGLAARLLFMTSAGGHRYLYVGIDGRLNNTQQLVFLGHELQHAVEIAGGAEVVDPLSLEHLYRRIGIERVAGGREGRLDSLQAIEIGHRVSNELHVRARAAGR
jgi:hypothetical protein